MTELITPIYAIPLTLILLVLSIRIIIERRTEKFAYGNNDSKRIEAKIRAQGNWSEYVPITLLLMLLAELQSAPAFVIHATGLALLIGRLLHGYGMSFNPKFFVGRVYGMLLTFAALAGGVIANLMGLL